MKTILPNAVRINVLRRGREATILYEEDFSSAALVKRTVAAMPSMKPLKISIVRGKTVRIAGTTDYSVIASMLASEFFMWTPIAEMTLRDLMILSVIRDARQS